MKINRKSRRMFLQGAGQSLLAIPFLSSIVAENVFGQTATAAKRYVFFNTRLDAGHVANMIPNPSGLITARNLIPNRQLAGAAWQPLREFISSNTQSLSRLYGTSLNGVLDYVNIMRGLDLAVGWGHGTVFGKGSVPAMSNNGFTNNMRRIATFDYFLMKSKLINPNGKILVCGIGDEFTNSPALDETGAQVPSISDFGTLYNRVFNNGQYPQGGGTSTGTVTQTTPAHRRYDVMNDVMEDYKRTVGSRNISAEDRTALNTAMDLFSDIQKGLSSGSSQQVTVVNGACSHSQLGRAGNISTATHNDASSKLLVDMVTAAFICDAARVFSFGFETPNTTGRNIHNDISHNPSVSNNWQILGEQQSVKFKRVVGPLAARLASVIDPSNGKSILYNSLLHTTFEHLQTHSNMCHPAILVGNAGGGLTAGNYIDYSNRTKAAIGSGDTGGGADFTHNPGLSYNRLFVTIAQAMGITAPNYEISNLTPQPIANIGGWGYGINATSTPSWAAGNIGAYDFTQFKNKLPMP